MLRYAPPIYTVIRREIIFVIFIILITVFIILYSVISNVSYSRLRIYCLIHTPLSPLSVCQPPRRGTVRHPYPKGSEKRLQLSVYSGYFVERGKERPEMGPP
jgi:hypothetical protein